MRIFRTFSLFILLASAGFTSVSSAAPTSGAGNFRLCLQRAHQGRDISDRDDIRIACVRSFRRQITLDQCVQAANGFEYSTNSETMRAECLLKSSQLSPALCAKVATKMEYGGSRDDLLWSCLERLNMSIGTKACRSLAQLMVYPSLKQRAMLYCENEIKASQSAPATR